MLDILIIYLVISTIFAIVFFFDALSSDSIKQCIVITTIFIINIFVLHIVLNLSRIQNYKIDKNLISQTQLKIGQYNIYLYKKYNVTKTQYDLPNAELGDYETYRIQIDSINYIDIIPSTFDSLHYKHGKKLYKE